MLCMEHRCQKDSFLNDGKRKKTDFLEWKYFPYSANLGHEPDYCIDVTSAFIRPHSWWAPIA